MAIVEGVKIGCLARSGSEDSPIYHLKDICSVMDWEFPRDHEDRKRLAKFSNFLQTVQGANAQQMLWNGMVAVLTRDDILEPTDMFLSKKEARKSRKRKRLEAKHGDRKNPITDEEKIALKKERGRLRRKAKKLAITIEQLIVIEEKDSSTQGEKISTQKKTVQKKKVARKTPQKKKVTRKTA